MFTAMAETSRLVLVGWLTAGLSGFAPPSCGWDPGGCSGLLTDADRDGDGEEPGEGRGGGGDSGWLVDHCESCVGVRGF